MSQASRGMPGYFIGKGDSIVRQNSRPQNRSSSSISPMAAAEVQQSKVEDGIAVIFAPHTTAAVTINEHADPMLGEISFCAGQNHSRAGSISAP